MDKSNLEMIACNVKIQLKIADRVKFALNASDVEDVKKYLEKQKYRVEIISESQAGYGIKSGINQFKHYLEVEKH